MCSRPGQSEAWPEQPVACARRATSRRDLGRLPPINARSIGHAHALKASSLQISSQCNDHHQFEHHVHNRARQPPGRAFVARASSGFPHERDELAAVSLNKACTNTGEGEWGWMDEGCMHAYDGKVQRAGIGSGLGRLHGLGDGGWKVTNEAMNGVGMRKNRKARLGKIGWNFGKPGVIRVTDPVGELRGFAGQRAGSGAHDGLKGLASEDQGGLPLWARPPLRGLAFLARGLAQGFASRRAGNRKRKEARVDVRVGGVAGGAVGRRGRYWKEKTDTARNDTTAGEGFVGLCK